MNKILFGLLLLIGFTNCSKDDDSNEESEKLYFYSELTNEPYKIINQKDNSTVIQKLDDKGNIINSYTFPDYPPTKTTINPGYGQDPIEVEIMQNSPQIVELQDVFIVNRSFFAMTPFSVQNLGEYNFIDILTKDLQQNLHTIKDSERHNIGYWNKNSFVYTDSSAYKVINSRGDIIKEKVFVNFWAARGYLKTIPLAPEGQEHYPELAFFEANELDEIILIKNEGPMETKEVNGKKALFVEDLFIYGPKSNNSTSLKSYFNIPYTTHIPIFSFISGKIEGNIFTVVLNVINQDGTISKHQLEINTDTNEVSDSIV